MLPYRDSRIIRIGIVVFFVLAMLYAYYETRGLLYGPEIKVPSSVMEAHEPVIVIRGSAERIAQLEMNGKAVPVTEDGAFNEPYVLSVGYNRIVLEARDKYGRTRERTIEILYTPARPEPESTSTPATVPHE